VAKIKNKQLKRLGLVAVIIFRKEMMLTERVIILLDQANQVILWFPEVKIIRKEKPE